MSDEIPPPAASPQPPKGPGETTQPGIASTDYVRRKLRETEAQLAEVARAAARAGFEESQAKIGKPVLSRKLTPWFLAGFALSGAITSAAVSDPAIPHWAVTVGTIGAFFFGAMLGIGPGWRK